MTAPRLSLIVLRCANLQRSREFYEAALGVEFAPERHGGVDHLAVRLDGGTVMELYPLGPGPASRVRLEFAVAAPSAALDRLRDAGFSPRTMGSTVLTTDPDGNGVAVLLGSSERRYTLEEACSRLGLDPGRVRERASQLRAEADTIPVVGQ